MANLEATKIALYGDLQKFGQVSDYERTLKTANKLLHSFPDDALAFHFRVVSLIQLSKFDDVLLAFNKYGSLGKGLEFEKAYALYRLNKIDEALKVLDSVETPELKHNELRAQVLYRLEQFEDCFNLYRDVIKQTSDDFDEERKTNLAAIIVNLLSSGKQMDMPSFEVDTYEIHYNIACYLMAKGNYLEAEKKLKEAEKICRESFDEDTPPDEVDDEKWQLGTVFIPDSVGYLIGTNFFGPLAYKVGRWRMAIGAMLLVAVSSIMVPAVQTIRGLAIPHFGLGLGIGAVDAALVPLLATLVDTRHSANYAVVYALQQTAVSLAYSLGPMIGGELAHYIGFPGLMRCVGVINLLFCPLLALLGTSLKKEESDPVATTHVVNYSTTQKYNKFNNAEDSD